MPPSGVDVDMAFVQWTLLLAVLLVGPVAAVSPLEPVDVEQIVTNLGSYFGELADSALNVDTASVSPQSHTHAHKCVLNRVKARSKRGTGMCMVRSRVVPPSTRVLWPTHAELLFNSRRRL